MKEFALKYWKYLLPLGLIVAAVIAKHTASTLDDELVQAIQSWVKTVLGLGG